MRVVAAALRWHRPLMIMVVAMAGLTAVAAIGLLVDDRTLTGAPVWLKPLKFGISSVVYAGTLAWLLSLQRRGRRWGWWLGTTIAVTLSVDVAIVAFQAARAKLSHYNQEDGINEVLQPIFGGSIYLMLIAVVVLSVQLSLRNHLERPMAMAIRAGLVVALLGMLSGFLMIFNAQPGQVAALRAGTGTVIGGHSVGVPDGGPGLPLTNWSTTGGDLRVGHFVGLHALQLLPLLAFSLAALSTKVALLRAEHVRTRLVLIGSTAYLGFFALVVWQALRGQPLLAPDLLTLGAAGGLVLATVFAVFAVLGAQQRAQEPVRVVEPAAHG
ncbi:hypothetical protein GCM10022247_73200 [Allokutzneria multivorans]|uniref:Uncharacterized protein n=1 Tax=Allokutzneria multivorans TaxID=1142134 RepID=A0ABP7U6E1_9PSEU